MKASGGDGGLNSWQGNQACAISTRTILRPSRSRVGWGRLPSPSPAPPRRRDACTGAAVILLSDVLFCAEKLDFCYSLSVTKKDAEALVDQWEKRNELLEEVRREEILSADTQDFIRSMSGVLEGVLADLPARNTSGLVEQQAVFSRLRP